MAVAALDTLLPFVWALPLLIAAYNKHIEGDIVGAAVLLALAVSILAGFIRPDLTVKYAFSYPG